MQIVIWRVIVNFYRNIITVNCLIAWKKLLAQFLMVTCATSVLAFLVFSCTRTMLWPRVKPSQSFIRTTFKTEILFRKITLRPMWLVPDNFCPEYLFVTPVAFASELPKEGTSGTAFCPLMQCSVCTRTVDECTLSSYWWTEVEIRPCRPDLAWHLTWPLRYIFMKSDTTQTVTSCLQFVNAT